MPKVQLEAAYEAQGALNDALTEENKRLRRELERFTQANLQQVRDMSSINTMRDLSLRQRALTQAGVPCVIHRGHIVHAHTRAVIP